MDRARQVCSVTVGSRMIDHPLDEPVVGCALRTIRAVSAMGQGIRKR